MKVKIIFLDYQRHDFTSKVLGNNIDNANFPFELEKIDMFGISKAINYGIEQSKGFDAIVSVANDILMPYNWLLRMVQASLAIENTGMCGIHTVEGISEMKVVNGIPIHIQEASFGNVLIPMKAIERVGKFNEAFDPYGMQDRDYSYRLQQTGHLNYYLHDLRAEHIGHDVGQDTPYRKMKDEGLSKCDEIWARETKRYLETNNYYL